MMSVVEVRSVVWFLRAVYMCDNGVNISSFYWLA